MKVLKLKQAGEKNTDKYKLWRITFLLTTRRPVTVVDSIE